MVNEKGDFINMDEDDFYNHFGLYPEEIKDASYIGEGYYYPRRWPDEYLSIEYLGFYIGNTREKTLAFNRRDL